MSHARPPRRIIRGAKRRAHRFLVAARILPAPVPPPVEPPVDPLRVREDELLAENDRLVRHGDLIAEVRDDVLSGDAFLLNFREIADALEDADVPFSPVPDGRIRQRVAVWPGRRADVLALCSKHFGGQAVYADLLGHDVTLATVLAESLPEAVAELEAEAHVRALAEAAARAAAEAAEAGVAPNAVEAAGPAEDSEPPIVVKGVRIYRPLVTGGRTLLYGAEHGCDVEFWDPATAEGAVASISETPFGWWVPSVEPAGTLRIGDRDYPVPAAFTQTLLEDVTFPVDAVITWVDDTDPVWQARRAQARAGHLARLGVAVPAAVEDGRVEGDGAERFQNRDELRYCLRAIAMYAPWIRHVFLVTDDQTPDWLDTSVPGLTVVSHRELFADPSALPVFNSHAIESQFHRIPGLAEHFLYFNDDVFLGRPLRPKDFFHGNGSPRLFQDARVIPPGRPDPRDDEYVASQKATRALLEREHGRVFTQVLTHTPHPMRRSVMAEVSERYADELAATTRSTFRSRHDLAPVTLSSHVAYLTNRAVIGSIGHSYVDIDRRSGLDEELPRLLAERSTDTFCLNDGNLDGIGKAEQFRTVVGFLQDYYPVTGPYERTPPQPARTGPSASG
ncbi:stealth family protein [Kitasatospora sp. NPDC085879]|uniref:stealth family protein n=1 Tax=Kitasatospora sp. NPDC085879 TaxID=3154769 RepID=UPI00342369FF